MEQSGLNRSGVAPPVMIQQPRLECLLDTKYVNQARIISVPATADVTKPEPDLHLA